MRTPQVILADSVSRSFVDRPQRWLWASQVPDVWPWNPGFDIDFNAGVLLVRPDEKIFQDMLSQMSSLRYPPKMAEQAFLNEYARYTIFRLPYAYNANLAMKRIVSPSVWKEFIASAKILHYTLAKPHLAVGRSSMLFSSPYRPFSHELNLWWEVYQDMLGKSQRAEEDLD